MAAPSSDKIKVAIRVRPSIPGEGFGLGRTTWTVRRNQIWQTNKATNEKVGREYTFDHVYDNSSSTATIFDEIVRPIVEDVLKGIHGTVLVYGQTGSGKTFTMGGDIKSPGIIKLAIGHLFRQISGAPEFKKTQFVLHASLVEIYREKINDLLSGRTNLDVKTDMHGIPRVTGCEERVVSTEDDIYALLAFGETHRKVGSTSMNTKSSRSHLIFGLNLEMKMPAEPESNRSQRELWAQLNLVDLAGSEKAGEQFNAGGSAERFAEGCEVNHGLMCLGQVMNALSSGKGGHVSYRGSNITRILQQSLGGNASTVIICAVSPAGERETISTLDFASRAKTVKNSAIVNERCCAQEGMLKILEENSYLKRRLAELEKNDTYENVRTLQELLKAKHEENVELNRNMEEMGIRHKRELCQKSDELFRMKRALQDMRYKFNQQIPSLELVKMNQRLVNENQINEAKFLLYRIDSEVALKHQQAHCANLGQTNCNLIDATKKYEDIIKEQFESMTLLENNLALLKETLAQQGQELALQNDTILDPIRQPEQVCENKWPTLEEKTLYRTQRTLKISHQKVATPRTKPYSRGRSAVVVCTPKIYKPLMV